MPDYIEREALTNSLDELCDRVCLYSKKNRAVMCGACPPGHAFDVVEELPAANVREVVRGEWKVGVIGWECSVCTCEANNTYPICPYCGADMKGGADGT